MSSRSTLLLSLPDAFVPSLTHSLRISCWRRSMTSASDGKLDTPRGILRLTHPQGHHDGDH